MDIQWDYLLQGLKQRFALAGAGLPDWEGAAPADTPALVTRAREEWLAARTLFENVTDPELVDYAIHRITAAEKKYIYLLRQAKAEGAVGEPF